MEFLFVDWGASYSNRPPKQFLFVEEAAIYPAEKAEETLLNVSKRPDFSRDRLLRKAVARAIHKVPTPNTRELLRILSKDKHREVRATSAFSLKAFPDLETLEDYSRLSEDISREVRLACISAVGEFIYYLSDHLPDFTDNNYARAKVMSIYEDIWNNSYWDRDKVARNLIGSLHEHSLLCFDEVEDSIGMRARTLCNQAAKVACINLLHPNLRDQVHS